jgi:hypothetical protein
VVPGRTRSLVSDYFDRFTAPTLRKTVGASLARPVTLPSGKGRMISILILSASRPAWQEARVRCSKEVVPRTQLFLTRQSARCPPPCWKILRSASRCRNRCDVQPRHLPTADHTCLAVGARCDEGKLLDVSARSNAVHCPIFVGADLTCSHGCRGICTQAGYHGLWQKTEYGPSKMGQDAARSNPSTRKYKKGYHRDQSY